MKQLLALSLFLAASPAAHAGSFFSCNNSPKIKVGLYYTVSAGFDSAGELLNVDYGTEKGSEDLGDADTVEEATLATARPDAAMKATSREWKNSIPFNISSDVFGKATLYIQPEAFSKGGAGTIVRMKLLDRNVDVNLTCFEFGN